MILLPQLVGWVGWGGRGDSDNSGWGWWRWWGWEDEDEEDKEDEDYNIDEFIAELILEANPQLGNSENEYDLRELTIAVRDALKYEYPMIKNLT